MVYPNPQIYPHLKAIFVHVPKAAGTSIEHALRESPDQVVGGHTTASGYRSAYPGEFPHYFKFAVLRHPVTRFLSAYRYLRTMPPLHALNNQAIHQCGSFDKWFRRLRDEPNLVEQVIHLMPQHRFVCDHKGEILVDRLYAYESLDEVWGAVCRRLGVRATPLPHLNGSRLWPPDLAVTDDLLEWIAAAYSDDFRLGCYDADHFEIAAPATHPA